MFALPFLFLFADQGARPIKLAKSGWFGGVNDLFVAIWGPALGRIVFCAIWLLGVAALFYALVIRGTARKREAGHKR